ncbi:Piso0_000053 [Millerozyma farinosa CBS 7064]|uniref:Piso0_000053 protein n=1 Tax=Pichia sorbitophila (strain ATCC MYA-4447 / BCRC 22081 / CBS 7064 / NBRC 10061 / NRRL Y-12695) TaxID=559304 RepID=G8YUE4_PICSO|nr:Piso0_000053 [Millerozyma farinosa CBS 7064]
MSEGEDILYEVKDRVTVITLNVPDKLNALNGDQYLLLAKLVERANEEEDTVATLIQSTGRCFSAGANFKDKGLTKVEPEKLFSHEYWLDKFVARNVYLTDLFHNHTKVLIAALNGPVIGLSAALVALCDLVYCIDESKVFLLAPFSNLGLVAEGATSSTLFLRLGWSKASEALLFARPISGDDLNKMGLINKSYADHKFQSTEAFNKKVFDDVVYQFQNLYTPSILANKQLLKANRDMLINSASSREVIKGFNNWVKGIPQTRFMQMAQKDIQHKL